MGNQSSFYPGHETQVQFCNPTGLYKNKQHQSNGWTVNEAKKLILAKRIAPRYPGTSSEKLAMKYGTRKGFETKSVWEECPICFRFYPEVNGSSCCNQKICSECYLNITHPGKGIDCPYCFTPNFTVTYISSPHGKEAACHEMVACLREEGNKSWELMDGEASDHLSTASADTMKELQKESVKQAYQAEADRVRISLAHHNLNKKNVLESYIPDSLFTPSRSLSGGSFGSASPMMDPGKLDELMLLQAIEASLKLEEEQKSKSTATAANNGNSAAAQMLFSPMLQPTKPAPSATMDTLTSSTMTMPITSPLTFGQKSESSAKAESLPSLSLPPSSSAP